MADSLALGSLLVPKVRGGARSNGFASQALGVAAPMLEGARLTTTAGEASRLIEEKPDKCSQFSA